MNTSSRDVTQGEQGIKDGKLRGENHPSAKLTWEQVDEIRSGYASKQMSQRDLGKMYGVGKSTIRFIVLDKAWKSENDPRRKQVEQEHTP